MPVKYTPELKQRAIELVLHAQADPDTARGAVTRIAGELADRAYSTGVIRAELRRRAITAVIPLKRDQIANRKRRGSAGGRPPAFDAEAYTNRNVVERSFNKIKQWRALATRYDKLAITYRAAATIFAILTWLRA